MRILILTLSLALGSSLAFAQEVSFSNYTKVNDRYDLFIIGGDEAAYLPVLAMTITTMVSITNR